MSEPFCYTYIRRRLIPGTGITVQAPDDNWDASAVSASPVDTGQPWEYSFIPRRHSIFITGLFDNQVDPTPRVANYTFGIEFSLFEITPIYRGRKMPQTLSWNTDQVVKLSSVERKFLIYVNGVERWFVWN